MRALYCDICKKEVREPITGRNFFHIREFDVCENCKDAIDFKLRPIVRGQNPYSTEWYEQKVVSFLEKASASGRA